MFCNAVNKGKFVSIIRGGLCQLTFPNIAFKYAHMILDICTKYEFCVTDVEKRIATADFHLDSYESEVFAFYHVKPL